ncbi:hypothetical protein DID78_01130 [Candidatus Marinamargulisbacteria bacterium SCGC AG-343-D04]|nr:hypothetical protein DID78_01130 [Candidatus Marinamargulisbacteria bacterium SCGC AG-343-D04]
MAKLDSKGKQDNQSKGSNKRTSLFSPSQIEKNIQLETVLKKVFPQLGGHVGEELVTHIMLVLKLEGIIGPKMGKDDIKMVQELKEKLLKDANLKKEVLATIKKIKKG